MFRKYYWCAALAVLLSNLSGVFAYELGAHVHVVATLQVALDEKTMTLNFSVHGQRLVSSMLRATHNRRPQ
jgi:hypothetical protein